MADRRRRRKVTGGEESDGGSEASDEETNGVKKSAVGSDGGDSEYESADEEELLEEEEEEDEDEIILNADGVPVDKDKQLDDDEDRKNPQYIPKKGTFYEHDDRTAATEEDVPNKEEPKEDPVKKEVLTKKKVWKEDDKWNHDRFNEYDQAPKSREELIAVYGYDIRNEEGPPRARRRRRYGRGPNKYTRNWEDLDAYSKPTRGGAGSPGLRGRGGSMRSLGGSRKTLESEEEFPALGSTQPHLKDSTEDLASRSDSQEQHWPSPDASLGGGDGDHTKHQHQPLSPHSHPPPKQQQHHQTPLIQQQQQQQQPPPQYSSHKSPGMSPQSQDFRSEGYGGRGKGPRGGRGGRGAWRGNNFKDQYRNSDERPSHGYSEGRQGGRGVRGGGYQQLQQQRGQPPNPHHQQHHHYQQDHHQHTPREVDDVMGDIKNMSITSQNRDEGQYRAKNRGGGGGGVDSRRSNMPPRLQQDSPGAANLSGRGGRPGNASPAADGSSSRPKRYSSQRQRSIPEQPVPPYTQQHPYMEGPVETGYQGGVSDAGIVTSTNHSVPVPRTQLPLAGGAPPTFVPPAFTTSPPTYPTEPFLGNTPAPRMFPPVTQAPHLFVPPVAPPVPVPGPPVAGPPPVTPLGAPPPVGAPTVPGPPVTGPPFLPPENMINFGGHPGPLPGAAPHPPQFPPFQGYTPGPVSQPGEIYSNGVTYYNTESQQQLPRAILPLQKRPKAAIPIVPPPERERRRREAEGRDQDQDQDLGGNAESQEDSEDYSVEGESVHDSYEDAEQQQEEEMQYQEEGLQQPEQQTLQQSEQQRQQQQQYKELQQQEELQQPEQQHEEHPKELQQQDHLKQEQQPEKQHEEDVKVEKETFEQHNQQQQQQEEEKVKEEEEEKEKEKLPEQRKEKEDETKEAASTGSVSQVTVVPQDVSQGEVVAGQEAVPVPGEMEAAPPEQQQQPTEAVAAPS